MNIRLTMPALATALIAATPAGAQLPNLNGASGALSGLGGASGLLGGGVPAIGSTGIGNAAGLLGYCLRNQLVGRSSGATSTFGALSGKPGVTGSSGFAAGQSGTVVTGSGKSMSLGNVSTSLKSRLCGLVLQHAKALIGGR